jgi:Uma2 family endonuclease
MVPRQTIPALFNGDRLTQAEFHRRYEASPKGVKAELIGGIVYMPSPVGEIHGLYSGDLGCLFNLYKRATPGVRMADNATTILGDESEPQPDLMLYIMPEHGGQTRTRVTNNIRYILGAPELVAEIAHSRVAIDLHRKRDDYQQSGVVEYIVWCVEEHELHWFHFPSRKAISPDQDGVVRSKVFPGLWLDVPALLTEQYNRQTEVLQQGLGSRPHAAFVKRLAAARKRRPDQGAP